MHVDRRSFVRHATAALLALRLFPARKASGGQDPAHERPLRIRIWCEGTAPHSVYPDDIDGALADQLGRQPGITVTRARLADPQVGLSDQDLDATDVLVWWGGLRRGGVRGGRGGAVV